MPAYLNQVASHLRTSVICLISMCTIVSADALADSDRPDDVSEFTKYERYYATYDVNGDGTHVETHEWALKVLAEQGIESANSTSVSYSERLQDAEILEAYTLKKDGRRLDAPASNYQTEGGEGKNGADPMFSDQKTKSVVFPDVAVGDTVVFSYRIVQKESEFPGHFSIAHTFSIYDPIDDVQIRLSAPASVALRVFTRDVPGGELEAQDGRRRWLWTFHNDEHVKPEHGTVSSMDDGPLILATTFKSYDELGAAYEARARPRSAVTERVRALADELTKDAMAPRSQVRALAEWVAKNIRFAGNCVGNGSVVPHEVDRVLANKMGDCKDHTALLQALMEAKGIASTPALVQSGRSYKLPELPVIEAFNHVMNYIPSLDLYVDSTATYVPFGSLPMSVANKPVLLTSAPGGIRRTPVIDHRANWARAKTTVQFASDASAQGRTTIEAAGEYGSGIKSWFEYMKPRDEEETVRRTLEATGFTGTGKLIRADVSRVAQSYKYGSEYRMTEAINLPGPGALYVYSPFYGPASVGGFSRGAGEPERKHDFICMGGKSTEEVVFRLPANAKILAVPRNARFEGRYHTYKSTYVQRRNTVTATRTVEQRLDSGVCAPEIDAEYRQMANVIRKDLRAQLVYR